MVNIHILYCTPHGPRYNLKKKKKVYSQGNYFHIYLLGNRFIYQIFFFKDKVFTSNVKGLAYRLLHSTGCFMCRMQ